MSTIYNSGSTCANIDTLNFLKIARWWLQSLSFQEFQGLAPQLSRIPQQAVETLCSSAVTDFASRNWLKNKLCMDADDVNVDAFCVSLDTAWLLNYTQSFLPTFADWDSMAVQVLAPLANMGTSFGVPGKCSTCDFELRHLDLCKITRKITREDQNSRWNSSKCSILMFKKLKNVITFHSNPVRWRLDTRFRELQRRGSEIAGDNTRCKARGTNATANSWSQLASAYELKPSMTGAVVGKILVGKP